MIRRCLVVAALPLLIALIATARTDVIPPRVYAIRDARVVLTPQNVLPKATVIIRDGLIESVGADEKVPADALVVEGKGLTVYPGFLDGLGHWGLDATQRKVEGGPPAVADIGSDALIVTPPDHRNAVWPEFRSSTALKADDEQTEAWRKAGFTARLVGPEGGILAGQGSVVSLGGGAARETVLRDGAGLLVAFRLPGGSDYPRSLMGIIAYARQTFLDAHHHKALRQQFEKSRGKGKRPPVDPGLAALEPYLDGSRPVIFEADTRDQIERAVNFARENSLRAIIYGGRDAWKSADLLKATNTPVLLRLNFSEVPKTESKVTPPKRVEQDRERRRKDEMKCAGVLAEKGVLFAFSSGGLKADKFQSNLRTAIREGLKAEAALRALTATPASLLGVDGQVGTVERGKAAHLLVTDGDFHEEDAQVRHLFIDGRHFEYEAKPKPAKPMNKPMPPMDEKEKTPAAGAGETASELDADRVPRIKTGGDVLIRGATVLTVSDGTKANTDVLVRSGKIVAVGPKLKANGGVKVIEADGMFVMPGIIDTHSHFAIEGGVNEFSLSVVPEVRVRDVINSEDVQIYRGLAGGVTTARLLHGSANVIGGQDAVIKLKYGRPTSELLVANAPQGVKFALGENVKRKDGRFPNSRMGVEAVLVRAFTEAKAYRDAWETYRRAMKKLDPDEIPPTAPRRDLRLEALDQILRGEIKIHCHCYRADEILMLLRVADRFGVKIKSLQHVLEGYKIAPEIADHGASCSLFSDWWAYKIEAFDAIPYAAALMQQAGAQVCLKSDSNELMRHMYQEAAKCVKYGGMSEDDALKAITLNPAKQLGLERVLGSVESNKDADLVIFNGHPLNSFSRPEMVLIEGEVYYQRSDRLTPLAPAASGPAAPVKTPSIPKSPNGRYVLTDVHVHPVGKPAFVGSVVIEKGRIEAVLPKPPGDTSSDLVIDGKGMHVYPGMIDAGTVIGLTELGSAKETNDYAETGDFQPDLRASTAVNPDSDLIPVTRANGVLSVVTRPTGAIIAGQSAVINLAGWVPSQMTVRDPLALHIDFPPPVTVSTFLTDPNGPNPGRAFARKQREERIRKLKELFRQSLAHDAASKEDSSRPANPRLEALTPYARGEKPVIIQAHREEEIREALKLAEELKLKVVLSGAIDAWKVAAELKKRDVPVILGPVMALPSDGHDPHDAPYACAAKLHAAGVRFCIRSSGGSNTRNLPYEAAIAVSYGLPPEEGLKAVTLYPAQILGLEKELGSIEAGKRANLVLTNGDILQASTQVLGLFIDGQPLPPTSKHTRLYERYLERLKEVQEGRAPLGTK